MDASLFGYIDQFMTVLCWLILIILIETSGSNHGFVLFFHGLQIKQICQASRHSMCNGWQESLLKIHLQHWRCNGDEYGIQRCSKCIGFPAERFP